MTVTALTHNQFMVTLHYFYEHGATENERQLARVAFDLYCMNHDNPAVIRWLNNYSAKVLST